MTEQEKWELKLQQKMEVLRSTHADIMDILGVMDANAWVSAEPVNGARYSAAHLEKFFENDAPDANTHGINFDKARFIP